MFRLITDALSWSDPALWDQHGGKEIVMFVVLFIFHRFPAFAVIVAHSEVVLHPLPAHQTSSCLTGRVAHHSHSDRI